MVGEADYQDRPNAGATWWRLCDRVSPIGAKKPSQRLAPARRSSALGAALGVGKQSLDQLDAHKGLACSWWALNQCQLPRQGCLSPASLTSAITQSFGEAGGGRCALHGKSVLQGLRACIQPR